MALVICVRAAPVSNVSSFSPSAPFNVSGNGFSNGSVLTVTRNTGTFAPKAYGTGSPYLFDTIAHQYLNGVDQNAYAGFSEGQSIAHLIYAQQSSDQSTTAMGYFANRTKRTQYDTAQMATVAMTFNGKGSIGNAIWPAAYGTRNNKTLYCSFWGRSKNNFQVAGGGALANKIFRISDATNDLGQGQSNTMTSGQAAYYSPVGGHNTANNPLGTSENFRGINNGVGSGGGLWYRHEVWLDLTAGSLGGGNPLSQSGQLINHWSGVMGNGQPFWTLFASLVSTQHTFEACHSVDAVMGSVIAPSNVYWDTSLQPFSDITLAHIGYDDGGGTQGDGSAGGSSGNEYDIAQVYMDPDFERFEISDSAVWNNSLGSTMNREIQGKWSRDSSTQCTVTISAGQWSSLVGKYLWYVNARNGAELIGQGV